MVNDQPNEMKSYYIAYFDILGYRDFFENQPDKVQQLLTQINDSINDAINCVNSINDSQILQQLANIEIKFRVFSDNILICMEVLDNCFERIRLLAFIGAIYDIQRRFIIYNGLFVRGSITRGTMSFNNNFIFGDGIIKAVEMEESAIYPRIVINQKLRNYLWDNYYTEEEFNRAQQIENHISKGVKVGTEDIAFYNKMLSILSMQLYNKLAVRELIIQWSDGVWFLSYLSVIDKEKIYGYDTIQSVLYFLKLSYKQDFETLNNLIIEDIDNIIMKHMKLVIEQIKKYGNNFDISIDNPDLAKSRERILKKYLWIMAYHNFICNHYGKKEYIIQAFCSCDNRFFRLTIDIQDNKGNI